MNGVLRNVVRKMDDIEYPKEDVQRLSVKYSVPETVGEVVRCINQSLAMKYRHAMEEIKECTGKDYKTCLLYTSYQHYGIRYRGLLQHRWTVL